MSKWSDYTSEILPLLLSLDNSKIARKLYPEATPNDLDTFRKYVALVRNNQGVVDACQGMNIDSTTTPMIWLKNKTASVRVTNPLFLKPEEKQFSYLTQTLIADLQDYAPKFIELKRIENKDSYLLVLDPADIHIGKLCSSFEVGKLITIK